MNPWIVSNLWLIPALPLAASLCILSLGKAQRTPAALLAIFAQVAAFVLAIVAFLPTLASPGFRAVHNFTWFTFGEITVRIGFLLDPLTAAMLVMITFVSLCIFIFSTGYMAEDANFTRFFAYLSFFSAAMLGVVISNSLLLFFVCWELVGLASYLLIGFWIHKPSAAAAAKKAFITTRIGDIGFFLGLLWLYSSSGTLLFYDNGRGCLEAASLLAIGSSATFIALLIFCVPSASPGNSRFTSGCPTRWKVRRLSARSSTPRRWWQPASSSVARVFPIFSLGAVDGVTPALTVVVWVGVSHGGDGCADRGSAGRHQTHSRLLDCFAAWLNDVSLGVGGVAAASCICSPTPSSRRCSSSAPGRSSTAHITSRISAAWAACGG
jgi:NADH-quinone oxidoreductase subunit L